MLEHAAQKSSVEIWNTLCEDVTASNFLNVLKCVPTVYSLLKSSIPSSLLEIVEPMVLAGMRIAILSRVNSGREIIEECALIITTLTEHYNFSLTPASIVQYVALASRVHLQIVNNIQQGLRENPVLVRKPISNAYEIEVVDYFEILSKDLRALYSLRNRFKKLDLYYKELIIEMEHALQLGNIESTMNNLQERSSFKESSDDISPWDVDFSVLLGSDL